MVDPNILEQAKQFAKANLVAVIATVGPDSQPEAATVHCVVDDELNVYFVTRRNTRKFSNIQANARVAVVVGTEIAPRSLQIEGTAELMSDKLDDLPELTHRQGLQDMYLGALANSPFKSMDGKDYAIFRVTPSWARWMDYDEKKASVNYHQILP